jgi:3-dehydroquinate synthase
VKIITVNTEGKTYDISIESGLIKRLPEVLKNKYRDNKIALITDDNVFKLYGRDFCQLLQLEELSVVPVVFKAGEQSKNIHQLSQIYDTLADNSFTRSDVVIAFGGGVTGDMAGLAAATFLRGMGFIQIPTTLLAMVDSSIGGKVAVDLPQGKNLVGTFYQPDMVYTDPELLKTLSGEQFANGMAELIKHGIIRDINLFNDIIDSNTEFNYEALSDKLDRYIYESCEIKRKIVEQDEFDNGIRQLLNFGHTIGHAIEKIQDYKGMSHGEAISIGMVIITRLTEKMGLTQRGEAQRLEAALKKLELPTELPDLNVSELINAISLDKKNRSGIITIAYIEQIGVGKLKQLVLDQMEEELYGLIKYNI